MPYYRPAGMGYVASHAWIRMKLGMTQEGAAARFGFSVIPCATGSKGLRQPEGATLRPICWSANVHPRPCKKPCRPRDPKLDPHRDSLSGLFREPDITVSEVLDKLALRLFGVRLRVRRGAYERRCCTHRKGPKPRLRAFQSPLTSAYEAFLERVFSKGLNAFRAMSAYISPSFVI